MRMVAAGVPEQWCWLVALVAPRVRWCAAMAAVPTRSVSPAAVAVRDLYRV
ncbi:MAG: hypothetical protein ACLP52_13430 [Streptosporangiaceae bacterium]